MRITPDQIVLFEIPLARGAAFGVNMTLAGTYMVMAFLFVASRLITRNFSADFKMTRTQNAVEVMVRFMRSQIEGAVSRRADGFIPLIGSLFVFILVSNWSAVLPIPLAAGGRLEWYMPPTASLSTTAALALVVLASVAAYGIKSRGLKEYLKGFLRPLFVMLPLNLLSGISKGVSLAVRLYGNMLGSCMIVAMLLSLAPLFAPALMGVYGLLAGTIQPYIFAMLAIFYIGAAMGAPTRRQREELERIQLARI